MTHAHVVKPDTSRVVIMYFVDPTRRFFSRESVKNFSSRETTRAQTKYRKSNTSGLGVRALYRTMFPEISAQWSLLGPTFRYLLPDREGEKCWSLNHAWQIPFFHSAQFIISSNFYIYGTLVPSSIVSALKEKQLRWAKLFATFENLPISRIWSVFSSPFLHRTNLRWFQSQ